MRWLATALLLVVWALPALALDPSEMLADPALEARARALDHQLRCVKCQSESIASSNADWAKDARRMVRELVADGASDAEVMAWFRARYGDFVIMKPDLKGANLLLWLAGPAMLLIAGGVGVAYVTGRRRVAPGSEAAPLTSEEEARVEALLRD